MFQKSFYLSDRRPSLNILALIIVILGFWSCFEKSRPIVSMAQNTSPMTDFIRPHLRISADSCAGKRMNWKFQDKSLHLFVPENHSDTCKTDLIIHFHGMPGITEYAVCNENCKVLVTINGGSGSASYEKLFPKENVFEELIKKISKGSQIRSFNSITLTGWSAGYGAIRAIIKNNEEGVDRVILLDGLHTSYIPEKVVLAQGGILDTANLESFLKFAQKAVSGNKQMIITHSSVFPGTFASTTECADYLINKLNLPREAVLKQGPVGMQQVGEAKAGNLRILSYAGNSAPDHVDHLHGLKNFLEMLK